MDGKVRKDLVMVPSGGGGKFDGVIWNGLDIGFDVAIWVDLAVLHCMAWCLVLLDGTTR